MPSIAYPAPEIKPAPLRVVVDHDRLDQLDREIHRALLLVRMAKVTASTGGAWLRTLAHLRARYDGSAA
jgi:hypothetical protein